MRKTEKEGRVMDKCCNNCTFKKEIEKWDYSHGGCEHSRYDGFACMGMCYEGVVIHMVGTDPDNGACEMFQLNGGKIKKRETAEGNWIKHKFREANGYSVSEFECDQCHTWERKTSKYCPECGARMKGIV